MLFTQRHIGTSDSDRVSMLNEIGVSSIDELVVTNSISLSPEAEKCSKIRVISLAPTIAECIRRLNNEESLSALFL